MPCLQARAHRIGQKNEVLVLRLQTEDSIEAHVLRVAADKRRFADSSITGGCGRGGAGCTDHQARSHPGGQQHGIWRQGVGGVRRTGRQG